jgi:lathosterol oxidase
MIFLVRNIIMERGVNIVLADKKFIGNIDRTNINKDILKIIPYYLSSTLVETLTHKFISVYYAFDENNIIRDLIYFIPVSFVFELVFDLFHYIAHRLEHSNAILYRHFHKIHHTYSNPTTLVTYHHHPIDLLISNSIPQIITMYVMNKILLTNKISLYIYNMMIIYKIFIEISGHSGKIINSSSFPQCIWLPKILGIGLRTEDHDNHHRLNNCNYSKRFKLWDIVFGTYKKTE